MRYENADRVFSCPRSFGRNFTSMERNFDLDEILQSDTDETALVDDHGDRNKEEELPKVLKNLSELVTNMSALLSMEKSFICE